MVTVCVTPEMVRRANQRRIEQLKTGEREERRDFLGRPIRVQLCYDQDELRSAWRKVHERFART